MNTITNKSLFIEEEIDWFTRVEKSIFNKYWELNDKWLVHSRVTTSQSFESS
jgi:hypothetical protein